MIALQPEFDDKLRALAARCARENSGYDYKQYLQIRAERKLLWLFKIHPVIAHIWVVAYNDHWRVMYIHKAGVDGPIWGVHYDMHRGRDADSCVLSVWKYISKEWRSCEPSETTAVRERIEAAIDVAYQECVGK